MESPLDSAFIPVWHFDRAWQREKRGKERGREVVGGSSGREEKGPSRALEAGRGLGYAPCLLWQAVQSPHKGKQGGADNYLDSICLISPKRYSITRELEILNYWCGISKGEPRKYANTPKGCPGGTQAGVPGCCHPLTWGGLESSQGRLWVCGEQLETQ